MPGASGASGSPEGDQVVIANAFSLGMLAGAETAALAIQKLKPYLVRAKLLAYGVESAIGHDATARMLTEVLATPIPMDRRQVTLEPGQSMIVAQLGARLPESAVLSRDELERFPVTFYLVSRE